MDCKEQDELNEWAKMHEEDRQEIRDRWAL